AVLGGRPVQGHAVGGVSWRHPDPAQPALRRAAHARHNFIGSISEPDVATVQGLRKTPGTLVVQGKAATSRRYDHQPRWQDGAPNTTPPNIRFCEATPHHPANDAPAHIGSARVLLELLDH